MFSLILCQRPPAGVLFLFFSPLKLIAEATDSVSVQHIRQALGEESPASTLPLALVGLAGETGRTRSGSKHNPDLVPCAVRAYHGWRPIWTEGAARMRSERRLLQCPNIGKRKQNCHPK
ncbi:hypothetical protein LZ30DRAFT_370198 [Colletotrichum cereale]|nr:hypothetical protein LZ30DRAFT_370198 [Colletotrichum cereale]